MCNSYDSALGGSLGWCMNDVQSAQRHHVHLWKMTNALLDESHQSNKYHFHPHHSIQGDLRKNNGQKHWQNLIPLENEAPHD